VAAIREWPEQYFAVKRKLVQAYWLAEVCEYQSAAD
jgi:hypothetical protein